MNFSFILLFAFFLVLFSCENELDSIKKITYKSSDPAERIEGLDLMYTDSGFAKVRLKAAYAESFINPSKITKLKGGVEVFFFSSIGVIKSHLTALNGNINEDGSVVVWDSVRFKNVANHQWLETEELHFHTQHKSIFTNRQVIIHSKDGVLLGDGIKTNQDFKRYDFMRPRGKLTLN